ncbi:MAG: hypothetical protein ACI31R_01660 [Bacilli bacterium]
MIGEFTLDSLCKRYGINSEKIVNKNNNILDYGEYNEIDRTLYYLVNELKVDSFNIEKCPSILYRSVSNIQENVDFLKKQDISFSNIESCLHVLSTDPDSLMETYKYVADNYGLKAININTSILSVPKEMIEQIENLNFNQNNKTDILAIAVSVSWGYQKIEEIQKILGSEEYRDYPELFTSETLAHAKLEDIREILTSDEYESHPELFTSTTLAHATLEDIREILTSDEYESHPELFTSTTLAHSTLKDIREILESEEYKSHPELFTSQTLAHAKLEDIREILESEEYKSHPELFTSETLAKAKLEDIREILESEEYKSHPELFTSTTLAHATLEDIREILESEEYKSHPELFTSTVLAKAKLEDIRKIFALDYWSDDRFKNLLTSSIVTNSKSMIKKIPILIEMAETYDIDNFLNTSFFLKSPSQNYALIRYLEDNNIPLVIEEKLNPVFSNLPGVLRKKYDIDLKKLMELYPYKESLEEKKGGKKK